MTIRAVVPAAGRGSRLGSAGPKILTGVTAGETLWSILRATLAPHVDRIHLVLSPAGQGLFARVPGAGAGVSVSVQGEPLGMGDAIFGAARAWRDADAILVVWGDQILLSGETISRAIAAHGGRPETAVIPVARVPEPYVQYVWDADGRLAAVRQSREGDACEPHGLGDVGAFLLSVGGLEEAWAGYLAEAAPGAATGEVNFLPFLPFLARRGWRMIPVETPDAAEARGVNTPEDLEFARRTLRDRAARARSAPPPQTRSPE